MKKFSKILSVALLVALVLSLGVANAFAAGEGSLTVTNAEPDTTYNLYKIFDLTGADTDDPANGTYDVFSYTIASKWSGFFTGAGASYLVDSNVDGEGHSLGLNPIVLSDGTIKYINITEDNKVTFTNAAMKYAVENSIVAERSVNSKTDYNNATSFTVGNLDLGYYLMVPVNAWDEKENPLNTTGSIASLTSTTPNGTIYVKAKKPGIEKEDNEYTAEVGQTVTYTITGKIPNTSGTTNYKYVIYDTMSTPPHFQKDVVVTIDGSEVTKATADTWIDYNNSNYANGFVIDIPVENYQEQIGDAIVLTYHAIVNENAIENTNEINQAKLKYGREPGEETEWIKEEVYSANIDIYKYTGEFNEEDKTGGTPLAGAVFVLMNSEGKYYKYAEASGTTPAAVTWVQVADAVTVPVTETTKVTDAQISKLVAAGATITTKTTDENGAASFDGLKDGTYYLIEIVAPSGYNRLDAPKTVSVSGNNVDNSSTHLENHAYADTNFDTANDTFAAVENNTGAVLPSTGGIGTTIFYVVGGVLVLAAIILLVTKKRMSE